MYTEDVPERYGECQKSKEVFMKEIRHMILCDSHSDRVDIHVSASLIGGRLSLSCQDLGPAVEEFWGDEDYEYWYTFGQEATAKLLTVINGTEDPEAAIFRNFSGPEGCRKLRALCYKEGIKYRFDSYV